MAICRICGLDFKLTSTSANEICSNEGCWKKAWNDAILPLKRKKVKNIENVEVRKNRRLTTDEKKHIIELYTSGKKRRQISDEMDIPYDTVKYVVKKYERTAS